MVKAGERFWRLRAKVKVKGEPHFRMAKTFEGDKFSQFLKTSNDLTQEEFFGSQVRAESFVMKFQTAKIRRRFCRQC